MDNMKTTDKGKPAQAGENPTERRTEFAGATFEQPEDVGDRSPPEARAAAGPPTAANSLTPPLGAAERARPVRRHTMAELIAMGERMLVFEDKRRAQGQRQKEKKRAEGLTAVTIETHKDDRAARRKHGKHVVWLLDRMKQANKARRCSRSSPAS